MVEITVRVAVPADVSFLRDALAKLNDEMENFAAPSAFARKDFLLLGAIRRRAKVAFSHVRYVNCALQYLRLSV